MSHAVQVPSPAVAMPAVTPGRLDRYRPTVVVAATAAIAQAAAGGQLAQQQPGQAQQLL